jgi:hypothetical protein
MYAQAMEAEQRSSDLMGEHDSFVKLQRIYATSGYTSMLREAIKQDLADRASGKYRNPVGIASNYALLGDEAHALEWLEKGYQEHSSGMQYLAIDVQFDSLRSNPRYQYWLGVLGLPSNVKYPHV